MTPSKRAVLEQLTRDELLSTVARFDLPAPERRVRDQLIEVIASSKTVSLTTVLSDLPRDRLKEICRGLEVDDAGREKSALVSRLAAPQVDVDETEDDSNLSVDPYLETTGGVEKANVTEAIARLRELEATRAEAEGRMNAYLHELTRSRLGGHGKVKRTGVGEVPEDWEVVSLDEVAVVQVGVAVEEQVESGIAIACVSAANVLLGDGDPSQFKSITVDARSVDRYRLHPGDVLFIDGGDAEKLGFGSIWRGQVDPCVHPSHVFAVRPRTGRLRPEFLAYWAVSPGGQTYFTECAKQAANAASVVATQLRRMLLPLPPIEVQDEIVAGMACMTEREDADRAVASQVQVVKEAILAALLTGELWRSPADS